MRVQPAAGAAACWSNVLVDGSPDPRAVHEGESLNAGLLSLDTALAAVKRDGRGAVPMKLGLNLWFTDRRAYPRPEYEAGGERLEYGAMDVQSAV